MFLLMEYKTVLHLSEALGKVNKELIFNKMIMKFRSERNIICMYLNQKFRSLSNLYYIKALLRMIFCNSYCNYVVCKLIVKGGK